MTDNDRDDTESEPMYLLPVGDLDHGLLNLVQNRYQAPSLYRFTGLMGKRRMGSEFLGKRSSNQYPGKRMGSEFLGKRRMGSEFLGRR